VENPDIVCNIHLGMARGLLMSEGEDPDALALHPFAEAGACVLMRSPTDAAVGTAGPA
jgi:hypothetical protein